jgi:hypothetical protein
MPYIVTVRKSDHSYWKTLGKALIQKDVLEDYGYRQVGLKSLPAEMIGIEDGFYFV